MIQKQSRNRTTHINNNKNKNKIAWIICSIIKNNAIKIEDVEDEERMKEDVKNKIKLKPKIVLMSFYK